jgi:hypothetical protein
MQRVTGGAVPQSVIATHTRYRKYLEMMTITHKRAPDSRTNLEPGVKSQNTIEKHRDGGIWKCHIVLRRGTFESNATHIPLQQARATSPQSEMTSGSNMPSRCLMQHAYSQRHPQILPFARRSQHAK